MEKFVCDWEYAQKLKELGVKQESTYYWSRVVAFPARLYLCSRNNIFRDKDEQDAILSMTYPLTYCSAFLSDELIELLPRIFKGKRDEKDVEEVSPSPRNRGKDAGKHSRPSRQG